MVSRGARVWPSEAAFINVATLDALRVAIVHRALKDVLLFEEPFGENTNRAPRIDEYLRRANVPEALILASKGWWCGAWVGAVWVDAGSKVPSDYASTDAWLPFLEPKTYQPQVSDAILYGVPGDAHHIGIVLIPQLKITMEGNRALRGFSNNGLGVLPGVTARTDILGYVRPVASRG